MDDVKLALEDLKEESESGKLAPAPARRNRYSISIVAAALVVLAAAGLIVWRLGRSSGPTPAMILTRLTSDAGLTTDPAFSPAGNLFAYASDRSGEGNLDIWVKQIAGGEPIRLTRDPADDHQPAFSPDGSRIAFGPSERAVASTLFRHWAAKSAGSPISAGARDSRLTETGSFIGSGA